MPVEVVCVGDPSVSERMRPLVLATREAVVNAARHSGAGKVDVYAEATPAAVDVFVRDRGTGFDPDAVAGDRHGLRDSIIDRMERHGGSASVKSRPGQGTEVRLSLPLEDEEPDDRHMSCSSTTTRCSGPACARRSATPSRCSPRPPTSTRRCRAVLDHQPEVVLLDVHLPGGGGAEVIRRTHGKAPNSRFLALSVSDAAEDVIGTIRAGARGYVTKTITGPELVDAIDRVAAGDAVFSPRLAGFVLDAFAGTIEVAAVDEDLDRLTEREREVMRLIARGYSYKEVAGELFISIKTVETHMGSVLRKLQLSSRHELTRWASERRLL